MQPSVRSMTNEWVVGKHRLNLINTGPCPTNCTVMINVTDDNDRPVFFYTAERTYGMKPIIIHFNQTISGFLLKFWQWRGANNQASHCQEVFILF